MATFDSFATNYQELVTRSIRVTGECPDYFAGYKAAYIAKRIVPQPARILDYGCGVGLLSNCLKRALPQARVDGFDISEGSIREISGDLLRQGVFTTNTAELLPEYDLIVLGNVLHHVEPKERLSTIIQAVSRVAPSGKLLIFEHNPANPLTRWAVSQCVFDEGVALLPVREIRRYLAQAGLSLVWRHYIVFFPKWLRMLRPLDPFLTWCPAGAQYVVVARWCQS